MGDVENLSHASQSAESTTDAIVAMRAIGGDRKRRDLKAVGQRVTPLDELASRAVAPIISIAA
jgi:hypothetical protein